MRWPWDSGGHPVRCPECGSIRPAFRILVLSRYEYRGGKVVELVDGARLACQDCPAVYSVGPEGTFRHHHESFPPQPGPAVSAGALPPWDPEVPLPRPKPPPRV